MTRRRKTTRTTIALSAEHRTLLQALAAKRGLRGYSKIIAEALDLYFAGKALAELQRVIYPEPLVEKKRVRRTGKKLLRRGT